METLLYVILLSFTFILAYTRHVNTTRVVVYTEKNTRRHKAVHMHSSCFGVLFIIISWYRYFCASFTTKYTLRVLYISSFIPLYFMSFPLLQLYTESEENGKRQQVYNKNDTNRYQTLAFVFRN